MTDFARCKDCAALTLDTDDDIRKHRIVHKDLDAKVEAQRRVANDAKQAVTQLRAEIAQYEAHLKDSLITVEPETINIHDFPDDEDLDVVEELEPVEYDDPAPSAVTPAAVPDYSGLPAIDRDDNYDVPTATPAAPASPAPGHTATAQNLFLG